MHYKNFLLILFLSIGMVACDDDDDDNGGPGGNNPAAREETSTFTLNGTAYTASEIALDYSGSPQALEVVSTYSSTVLSEFGMSPIPEPGSYATISGQMQLLLGTSTATLNSARVSVFY